jgi:hypothetical protein
VPWAKRNTYRASAPPSPNMTYDFSDYSLGVDTYTSNDKIPLINGGSNYWRLAQDARIITLGEYETRKGFDYYSDAAGETQDQAITSVTGAADQSFNTVTRLAQSFTTTSAGSLSKVAINLKNAATANGIISVNIYSDNAGVPGTLLGTSSIADSTLTTSYAYYTARFANAPTVTTATKYWIVVYVQAIGSGSFSWSSTTSATTAFTSTDSGNTWSSTSYALNFKQYYSTTGGVKGIFRGYKNDGTKVTLIAHGTSLYSVNDGTGALTAIKTGLNASATTYRFAMFNDIIYYVNGYDGYRKWDFTTESQVNSTNYTLICSHIGLIFLGGGVDPNAVFFSNFGLPEKFTSTDFIYADAPKTGDPPTAFNSLNGSLYISTQNKKFILSGTDNTTFKVDRAPDDKGTYTQETITQDDNYMYHLADDGIYMSNGSQGTLLSGNNYEDIVALQSKASACLCINRGRLYVWYQSPDSGVNDTCAVYNLNSPGGKKTLESIDTNAYVNRAVNAFKDNDNMIVGSSLVGKVYWQEKFTNDYSNDGCPLNFILQTPYLVESIRFRYKYYGGPSVLKGIRKWDARFGTNPGNYTVDCQYAYDERDNWTTYQSVNIQGVGPIWGSGIIWGQFTWGTSAEIQAQMTVPGEYARVATRFVHTGMRQPIKFLGQTLLVEMRRMR